MYKSCSKLTQCIRSNLSNIYFIYPISTSWGDKITPSQTFLRISKTINWCELHFCDFQFTSIWHILINFYDAQTLPIVYPLCQMHSKICFFYAYPVVVIWWKLFILWLNNINRVHIGPGDVIWTLQVNCTLYVVMTS